MRRLATEALADPDFVADLRETMHAYRHMDKKTGRPMKRKIRQSEEAA